MSNSMITGWQRPMGTSALRPLAFRSWKQYVTAQATAGSRYAHTAKGLIQYTDIGSGPCVLHAHGSPAGCDAGPMAFRDLVKIGFRLITPSRPGFLDTPLAVGRTPEEQADAFASLLDTLVVDRVVMLAWSGGGPSALQFALRHPERIRALIMYAALSHRWTHRITLFERLVLSDRGLWLLSVAVRAFPDARRTFARELGLDYDYVQQDPARLARLEDLFELLAPASQRWPGSKNDIEQFSRLPRYPVERIRCPVLVVFSPTDRQLPISNAEFLANHAPEVDYLCCAEGGHVPLLGPEGPDVLAAMLRFLRRHASGGRTHRAASIAPFKPSSTR